MKIFLAPRGARDLVKLGSDSNGGRALSKAIEEVVEAEESKADGA